MTCCYAVQDKVWVDGPDGAPWEIYTVLGDSEAPNGDLRGVDTCGRVAAGPRNRERRGEGCRRHRLLLTAGVRVTDQGRPRSVTDGIPRRQACYGARSTGVRSTGRATSC